jgi:hypothetical protein
MFWFSSIVGGGSSNFSIAFMAQNQNATLDPLLVFHFNAGFAPRVVDLSLVTCCSTLQGTIVQIEAWPKQTNTPPMLYD